MTMTIRKFLGLLWLVPLLATGCSTTVTNLTPRQLSRNPTGLYKFEVAMDTNQRSLQKDTVKAFVVVGTEMFPMMPTMLLRNRWETLVPIPADQEYINYRFKFDYEYLVIPQRKSSSKLSPPYQLHISGQ